MTRFVVGDKVRRIKYQGYHVEIGEICEIEKVYPDRHSIGGGVQDGLNLVGKTHLVYKEGFYNSDCFELVEKKPVLEVIKAPDPEENLSIDLWEDTVVNQDLVKIFEQFEITFTGLNIVECVSALASLQSATYTQYKHAEHDAAKSHHALQEIIKITRSL